MESKVVEIFNAIGVDASKDEIVACHRIGISKNNSKTVIVRLFNATKFQKTLYSRQELRSTNNSSLDKLGAKIFINRNLKTFNQKLASFGRKRPGLIYNCFTADGVVLIQRTQDK